MQNKASNGECAPVQSKHQIKHSPYVKLMEKNATTTKL